MHLLKVTLVMFLLATPLARGDIYRWYENGVPHYADHPPHGIEAERIPRAAPAPAGAQQPNNTLPSTGSFLDLKARERAKAKTQAAATPGTRSAGSNTGPTGNDRKRSRQDDIMSLTERKEAYRKRNDPDDETSDDQTPESERSNRVSKPQTLSQKKAALVRKRREANNANR